DYVANFDAKTNTIKLSLKSGSKIFSLVNNNKGTVFVFPTAHIYATAIEDGKTIVNVPRVYVNNIESSANSVENPVDKPAPTKSENVGGIDSNGKTVIAGDVINYNITWDFSKLVNPGLSDLVAKKGLSLDDDYDDKTEAIQGSLLITDANNKAVNGVSVAWDTNNSAFKLVVDNPRVFVSQYAGQKLKVSFNATVKDDLTGEIKNKAVQNNFGVPYETNTVTN
ncbi:SspB-related isopeptide-forming adhesin, partial [Ligilactobacillus equi]|uniref:SspB-related isopeptide-forming adhesin n=1 Tax=Ligilactobacillus equi TaxID=137357 RepID=UPI000B02CBE1